MIWILAIALFFVVAIIVFLKTPYSVTKAHFNKDINSYTNRITQTDTRIAEQDIKALPEPVQNHFRVSGYLGKVRTSAVKAYITSALLKDTNDKPPMVVDYTLCSFADELSLILRILSQSNLQPFCPKSLPPPCLLKFIFKTYPLIYN